MNRLIICWTQTIINMKFRLPLLLLGAFTVDAAPFLVRVPETDDIFGRAVNQAEDEDAALGELDGFFSEVEYMCMSTTTSPAPSPPTESPTSSPSANPTDCELTEGTEFIFDSYVMEADVIFDDVVVHHKFSITIKCDCHGKAVNGGSQGPSTVVNNADSSVTAGPIINAINNGELQVDWEGGAVEEDAPGWSIAATGVGLCFTPAAKAGVCIVLAGLATEVFDDEILWGYRRSAVFSCVESGDSYKVNLAEAARIETFVTNDSEYYTRYETTSPASAAVAAAQEGIAPTEATSTGTIIPTAGLPLVALVSAFVVISM